MKLDDRELLRDLEKMPLEARAALEKARLAKAERRFGLAPLGGDSPFIEKAAKARLEAVQKLQAGYPVRYRRVASDLKRKGLGFWLAHQTFSPLELLVSMELGLEPFEEASPNADAASAIRIRLMTELHEMASLPAVQGQPLSPWRRRAILSSLAKQGAEFWLKAQDFTAERLYETHALERRPADLVPFDVVSPIEHKAAEAYARLMDDLEPLSADRLAELERKGAEFWHAHRDFTAEELLVSLEENLAPLAGDTEETRAASKARVRFVAEMRNLKQNPRYLGKKSPYYLGPLYRFAFSLKKKDAAFWHAHQNFTAKELLVSQSLDLEPFQSASPVTQTAAKARARIFTELYDLRWADRQIARRYQKIAKALKEKEADFWYAHQDFTALELLELHFPETELADKPASRPLRMPWLKKTAWLTIGLLLAMTIAWGIGALTIAVYLFLIFLVAVGFASGKLGNP